MSWSENFPTNGPKRIALFSLSKNPCSRNF